MVGEFQKVRSRSLTSVCQIGGVIVFCGMRHEAVSQKHIKTKHIVSMKGAGFRTQTNLGRMGTEGRHSWIACPGPKWHPISCTYKSTSSCGTHGIRNVPFYGVAEGFF